MNIWILFGIGIVITFFTKKIKAWVSRIEEPFYETFTSVMNSALPFPEFWDRYYKLTFKLLVFVVSMLELGKHLLIYGVILYSVNEAFGFERMVQSGLFILIVRVSIGFDAINEKLSL